MEVFKIDLPKVLNFESANPGRLNLPLHSIYHRKLYDIVKAVDNTKLKMPAGLMPGWDKGIVAEENLVRESSFSRYTAKLLEKDGERDKLLKSIFLVVEGNKFSAVEANSEAAFRINEKLHIYANAYKSPFDVESSLIIGIKKDMAPLTADITTLGLTASLNRLYTVNDEYLELQKTRSLEEADTQIPAARIVRPQTDAAFNIVCLYIQMAFLSATTGDDKALFDQLVDRMNKISRETQATQSQMLASRKPKDPKTPDQPKTPKEPKQPKEPKTPDQPKDPKQPEKPGGGAGEQSKKPKDPKKPGDDGNPDITLPEE